MTHFPRAGSFTALFPTILLGWRALPIDASTGEPDTNRSTLPHGATLWSPTVRPAYGDLRVTLTRPLSACLRFALGERFAKRPLFDHRRWPTLHSSRQSPGTGFLDLSAHEIDAHFARMKQSGEDVVPIDFDCVYPQKGIPGTGIEPGVLNGEQVEEIDTCPATISNAGGKSS